MSNTILNVFPSQDGNSRLVLARETDSDGRSQLVLRQETQSDHVGWFIQSRVAIDAGQVAALKMTLTSRIVEESTPSEPARAILRIDSAMAG